MVPVVLSEKDTFDNNSTYNFENYEKFKLHHFGVLQHSSLWPYIFLIILLPPPPLPEIQLLLGQLITKMNLNDNMYYSSVCNSTWIRSEFLKYLKI